MKPLVAIILVVLSALNLHGSSPFCHVRHYDEHSGLSLRSVKQILQDREGLMWFATWNGLNRFDGYEFTKIKPGIGDEARAYSDRIGDMKLTSRGDLLCRVDDRLLLLDTGTYRFSDISSRLESKFGRPIETRRVFTTADGDVVTECGDGCYVLMNDTDFVESATLLDKRPDLRYLTGGNRKLGDVPPYRHEDLVYSKQSPDGSIWIITRNGEVLWAPSRDESLTLMARLDTSGEPVAYGTTDRDGNIWLRSTMGAYCITTGNLPYDMLPQHHPSQVRTSCRNPRGGVWVSEIRNRALALYDDSLTTCRYLGPDGRLHDSFTELGLRVYTIACDLSGNIWLGTKPDGLLRLAPDTLSAPDDAPRYLISRFAGRLPDENVYDIEVDGSDRLWVATLGGGIVGVVNPADSEPTFVRLADSSAYPAGAMAVRDIAVVGDSLLVAATRGGLLVAAIPDQIEPDNFSFKLHTSSPHRESSLGNIAVMNVAADRDGHLLVATESDGVNMLLSPLTAGDTEFEFRRFNELTGIPSDVTISVTCDTVTGKVWVVSNGMIYSLDTTDGKTRSYASDFWHNKLRFSEGSPVRVDNDRWLIGLETGGMIVNLDSLGEFSHDIPVVFTSALIQNRSERILSAKTDSIVLAPDERNVTISFAALDYTTDRSGIKYAFRIDGGQWNHLGSSHSVSFLDLDPGTYHLEVRSSDSTGRWLDNEAQLTMVVTPVFWETTFAKVLYVMLFLLIVGWVTWLVIYIRRINARQHETLEAYLKLLENPVAVAPAQVTVDAAASSAPAAPKPPMEKLSPDDEMFMRRVIDFVNSRLSDAEASVDEMAEALATSRSGLTRKMKALLGVTPAEFLKESRLSRAASLIASTDMPIKKLRSTVDFPI